MAVRTDKPATRPTMTPARWAAILVIIAALLGVGYCAARLLFQLGNEPPIRVRNGSMEVVLDSANGAVWQDDGNDWSPSEGKNSGAFEVKVESAGGHTCGEAGQTSRGKDVSILYSDGTDVTFRILNSKTKVKPKDKLTKAGDRFLRLGQPGDGGFITKVAVKGGQVDWECTFGKPQDLSTINICPAPHKACE